MAEDGTSGAVHLLCLAASSGVPLFCRSSRGGAPSRHQLPFSVIGSLNGVHMFGQNLDVTLRSARTEDTAVVWKTFHDSVTLIVLSSEPGCSELRLERLLELVFGAMVLLVGLEELTRIRNVERLKKELRATYGLIDSLLGDAELAGDLTQCVDCIAPGDGPLLQEALAGFAEEVGSVFASLVVGGRVVVGTEGWWRLGSPEAVLLPWLVGTLPAQAARDYPVYLPHGSPTVPHRLLTLMLLPRLELCVLCGPQPPLSQLEPQVLERWWQPVLEPLRACLALAPRAIPAGFSLHPDILGLLFLHLEQKRAFFTVDLGGEEGAPEWGAQHSMEGGSRGAGEGAASKVSLLLHPRSFPQDPPAPPPLLLCAGHCHPLPSRSAGLEASQGVQSREPQVPSTCFPFLLRGGVIRGKGRRAGVPHGGSPGLLCGVWGSCQGAGGPGGPRGWAQAGGDPGGAPPPPAAGEPPEPNACPAGPGHSDPARSHPLPLGPQ
uniref:Fuzzy planar cell polarity protein n=1 Tax=Sarcophilus harrisii TaxID=9305 RepID=A0A7N4NJT3_SARHA